MTSLEHHCGRTAEVEATQATVHGIQVTYACRVCAHTGVKIQASQQTRRRRLEALRDRYALVRLEAV